MPVSDFVKNADGTFEGGTSKSDKRKISSMVPKWNKENCIECNQCVLACPHAVIRSFSREEDELHEYGISENEVLPSIGEKGKYFYISVNEENCTGCELCKHVCPGKNGNKAISLDVLNNRLNELELLKSSPKINVTITKYNDVLYKDINTILDLITAGVICDKVYKKGQGDYAILDYLKTGNSLKFTSKYKARDLATNINRDSCLKLLLENILKKYIYITSSNGKDIIIDYLTPLLTKEKIFLKDILNNLLNNEEMLKSCIKHFDYAFLNTLSDKSLNPKHLIVYFTLLIIPSLVSKRVPSKSNKTLLIFFSI